MTFKQLHRFFSSASRNVVVVDGCRIPFSLSSSIYNEYLSVDLGAMALRGLHTQTAIDPNLIDYIFYGNVIQECRTSNIAREASMAAGYPKHIPSSTVAQACISANQAICCGVEKILCGKADIVVAGGAETFSDVPIRFSRSMRETLIKLPRISKQGPIAVMKHLSKIRFKDFKPELPAIANYTTGEVMGISSDRLSARFGISRADQDKFAIRSHQLAAKAHQTGLYKDEIIPVKGSTAENGIKPDSTYEKISTLSPAFIKPHGTHTAANSSYLTDGASAILLMSEEKALQLGYKPKSYIRTWAFAAVDPFEDLLLGPTFAISQVLQDFGLKIEDIGVVELHEAFAGQVLSNLKAMNSDKFADEYLNGKKVGEIPMDILNTLGGSLSLGHPFGATGARLVTTASNRLQREGKRFALIGACADGGLGHACILERYENK